VGFANDRNWKRMNQLQSNSNSNYARKNEQQYIKRSIEYTASLDSTGLENCGVPVSGKDNTINKNPEWKEKSWRQEDHIITIKIDAIVLKSSSIKLLVSVS